MFIRELGNKSSKELLYRIYEAINDDFKSYQHITKKECIDNIEIRYQDIHVLKNFISNYELDLIEQVYYNNQVKCTFIHKNLIDRFILIKEDKYVRINPELLHVLEPLIFNEIEKDEKFKYDDYVLGLINYFGYTNDDTIYSYLNSFYNYSLDYEEFLDYLSTSSLVNYFCLRPNEYSLCCYNLFDDIETIDNHLNKIDISDCPINIDNIDSILSIAKHNFDNTNPKINKMIENIYELEYDKQVQIINQIFQYAHLNKEFIDVEKYLNKMNINHIEIYKDAYLEMSSASLWGTKIKNNIQVKKTYHYDTSLLENKTQINAHLNEEEARLFYELYYSLLEYVNDKYKVCEHIDRIINQRISILDILKIRDFFIEHKEIIDEFIIECKDFFSDEEIEIIKEFKNFIYGYFMAIKFEENHTLFMNGKDIIAAIGTYRNVSDEVYEYNLPVYANWMLLPYKGKIIWDGLLYQYSIPQDKEMLKEMIANRLENTDIIYEIKKYN